MPELIPAAPGTTATDPHGIVHRIDGNTTLCGKSASGWSRFVTDVQLMGLVIFCDPCYGQPDRTPLEEL